MSEKYTWGVPTRTHAFRLPSTVCLGCLLDEIWGKLTPAEQQHIVNTNPQLERIGKRLHTCHR